MNSHVRRYYRKYSDEDTPLRLFHDVINLNEYSELSWVELSSKAPTLPRGWFELSRLKISDRIEFTRDYWLSILPFHPVAHKFLHNFFSKLDDVGVFLTQTHFDAPFQSELVYSLKDGSCFFHGYPPCSEEDIALAKHSFEGCLPEDFLLFLRIHNGFSKHLDWGMISAEEMPKKYQELRQSLLEQNLLITCKDKVIDPADLIPFYESFEGESFQCFYLDWYPSQEVGNVFYSKREHCISDYHHEDHLLENLAFPTFLEWLIFYLEGIGD